MTARRSSALAKARRWGFDLVDDVTIELVAATEEQSAMFHKLTIAHMEERGLGQPDEEAVLAFGALLPASKTEDFQTAVAAYSDGQTAYVAALQEVAFTMGVSFGLALAGKDGGR